MRRVSYIQLYFLVRLIKSYQIYIHTFELKKSIFKMVAMVPNPLGTLTQKFKFLEFPMCCFK